MAIYPNFYQTLLPCPIVELRGAPVACSLPDMGYMSLFIVLPLLCLPRLRTICTEEKYWGRL